MDKSLAARRLSAALGEKVDPSRVVYALGPELGAGWVRLTDGRAFRLAGGNAAQEISSKRWVRNGKSWEDVSDNDIRPLAG